MNKGRLSKVTKAIKYRTLKTSRRLIHVYARVRRKRRKIEQTAKFSSYTCEKCGSEVTSLQFAQGYGVCLSCGQYLRLKPRDRIALIVDTGSFRELLGGMKSKNLLEFPDYDDKLEKAVKQTGNNEALVMGTAKVNAQKCCIAVMDSHFIMGSMGSVVGEKLVLLFEYAMGYSLPVIVFCASGGARMQEGIISLMQMARVSFAVSKHSRHGLLYISVLTHPTTGGVSASFAMQGDIILAEPKATIGFAGKRVIEGTINQTLPESFQTAEFCREYGHIDAIVERKKLREILSDLLFVHSKKDKRTFRLGVSQ